MRSILGNLSLPAKIIAVTVTLIVGIVAANYVAFVRGYKKDMLEEFTERAAAFTAVADEAKSHAAALILNKSVDTDTLIAEALADVAKGKSYTQTRFFDTIPVVVGWTTAEKAAQGEASSSTSGVRRPKP